MAWPGCPRGRSSGAEPRRGGRFTERRPPAASCGTSAIAGGLARLSEGQVERCGAAGGCDCTNGGRRRRALKNHRRRPAEHPRSPVAWPGCLRGRSSGAELLEGCDFTNGGRRRRALKNYRRRPAEHPRSPVAWPGCPRGRSSDAELLGGCDCTNGGQRRRALKNYRRRPAEHPRSPVACPGCPRGRSSGAEPAGGAIARTAATGSDRGSVAIADVE